MCELSVIKIGFGLLIHFGHYSQAKLCLCNNCIDHSMVIISHTLLVHSELLRANGDEQEARLVDSYIADMPNWKGKGAILTNLKTLEQQLTQTFD